MIMKTYFADSKSRLLRPREQLPPMDTQVLWRVESGALRVDTAVSGDANCFVRMALPGDVLGVESLVGATDQIWIRALTATRLAPVTLFDEGQLKQILMDAVATGYQRCCELATLRAGTTDMRVKRLLLVLANRGLCSTDETVTCALPSLSDMASIVNAAPETVCRALASLRQINFLQDCSPKISKHSHLKHREHRLQPGALPIPTMQKHALN